MLETLVVAVVVGFFALLLIGAVINWANSPTPAQEAEKQRRLEKRQAVERLKDQWVSEIRSKFQFCTAGRIIGHPYAERCVFAFDQAEQALRLYGYTIASEFKVLVEANIPITKIMTVEIVRPMEMKRVKRTQAVGMVSATKKSPVARGLVGGAVLGPAGLVLGAASGASRDIKTTIKEHTVWDQVQMEGDPQLHIGTYDLESPLIRIKPDSAGEAEEWQHRIRALQSAVNIPAALT